MKTGENFAELSLCVATLRAAVIIGVEHFTAYAQRSQTHEANRWHASSSSFVVDCAFYTERERERERERMTLDMKYGGFILNDLFE